MIINKEDSLIIANKLIGWRLVRNIDGQILSGIINETEAYIGTDDLANHASRGKTPRNEIMFGPAGHAYIYLIYGIYNCLNIVAGDEGFPAAVLIRSIIPKKGVDEMMMNRNKNDEKNLTNGPGKLCQAMKIERSLNGIDLTDKTNGQLWIEKGIQVDQNEILQTPRIGVDYAGEHAKLPWRFVWKGLNKES